MEGEEIGMVLGRAWELKNKFNECIHNSSSDIRNDNGVKKEEDSLNNNNRRRDNEEEEEEEEEEESLLVGIRDAFEALGQQLSSLQALQQQQRYERESSLFQIDRSRKILLSKLREYKGDNLAVIDEALTFAGGTLDHDDDLLLPPYPNHLPDLFVMDDSYPSSRFNTKYKLNRNGVAGEVEQDGRKSVNGLEAKQWGRPTDRNKPQGIRRLFGFLAKSVLTFVGVISVLSLAGFKPSLRKDGTRFKFQELLQQPAGKGRQAQARADCPPGKVVVIEGGQPRCLVKERVEMPFDLDVIAPKINYGVG